MKKTVGIIAGMLVMLAAVSCSEATEMNSKENGPPSASNLSWRGELQAVLKLQQKLAVEAIAWAPKGEALATLDDFSNGITVWDLQTGTARFRARKRFPEAKSLSFISGGSALLVTSVTAGYGDLKSSLSVLDSNSGAVLRTLSGPIHPLSNAARAFAVSSDERYVAMTPAGDGQVVAVYSTERWSLERSFKVPVSVTAMAFSPKGNVLALGGIQGWVQLCDIQGGTCGARFKAHPAMITALAFSPDGQVLFAGMHNALFGPTMEDARDTARMHEADRHKVRGFDVRTSRQIGQINSDAVVVVFSLCIDPAGNIMAVADGDAVWLFDAHSFERIQKISVDTDNVDSVAFSPDGNRLAIGGRALLTIVRPKKQN